MMHLQVELFLGDTLSWRTASPAMRRDFLRECEQVDYGRDATIQAWIWYYTGASAAENAYCE